ncbi:hypothetical protein RJT34_15991 [Clitoria ternatea]|uniref:Uncharacterized protein n=1 Tax=Clitoria ternatea TaxID=43366 RepID=A0AAN9J6E9_CLITE
MNEAEGADVAKPEPICQKQGHSLSTSAATQVSNVGSLVSSKQCCKVVRYQAQLNMGMPSTKSYIEDKALMRVGTWDSRVEMHSLWE